MDEATEREHIRKTIEVHEKLTGQRPLGIYQGKPNMNTRQCCLPHRAGSAGG
jgi:hypothetical protein